MAISCGLPPTDCNMIFCAPSNFEYIITKAHFRVIQFTGSSTVANHLSKITNGKVKIEDAGFDWKILGPDVQNNEYIAW